MNKEFKQLQEENNNLRDKIIKILLKKFSTIDDDYQDLWDHINQLINNEVAQEKLCNI